MENQNLNLTNDEIEKTVEENLADMSEEEREAVLALNDAADRLAIIQLRNRYGVNIELIPNDMHHILLDGQKMGYVEFAEWLNSKMEAEQELQSEFDINNKENAA